ncbi:MAG: hypothetical protein PUE01_13015 [Clostridiaceae bacterium]|nr:hypothetical protein [Clostridiaceae bacterium]
MKDKIISYLKDNKDINKLLNQFIVEFNRVYENLLDEEKDKVLNCRNALYRKWLFSPIIYDTYISPYYIVNSVAQEKFKGSYSVMPTIKMDVQKNKINFEVVWLYYSEEENPVVKDIEELINFTNPVLVEREENKYSVDNGEELIGKITFTSGYYVRYLILVCLKLGILKEMTSIGCKCYSVSEKIKEYEALNNKEKIKLIIEKSIDVSNDNIEKQFDFLESYVANDFLNNGITQENIYPYVQQIENSYKNYYGDDEINLKLAFLDFGISFDMNFTSIFTDYLGLCIPVFALMNIIDLNIKLIIESENANELLSSVFSLELGHDLSPLGQKIFKSKKKLNDSIIKFISSNEIGSIIKEYSETIADFSRTVINEIENQSIDDYDFDEEDEQMDEFIKEQFGNMPRWLIKHITEFYDYLIIEKGLKEQTCEKHCENIELFLWSYMNISETKMIKKICKEDIENFLAGWFIEHVAMSKNNLKEQMASIGQYIRFLENENIMDKKKSKSLKEALKDKDKYYKIFEEYMDYDLF